MEKTNDVDLDKVLDIEPEPQVEEPLERPLETPDVKPVEQEEDTMSPRAQERIRELVEEKKHLEDKLNTRDSNELDTFINSIQDAPSRELLKTYGSLLQKSIESRVAPVVDDYQAQKFEKEFSQFAGTNPDLAAHKDDIRKTYLRNPSQSLKGIVGERLVDIATAKIKPLESTPSAVNRNAAPSLEDASTEDLYALLESKPPIL